MKNCFKILIISFLLILPNSKIQSDDLSSGETLLVLINGLVCDFCARSIEKVFNKQNSVKNVNINLEKMLITINLKSGEKLDDTTVKRLVEDSGYDVQGIERVK